MNKPTSTTSIINASAKAQADLRRAAESIEAAFAEIRKAKALALCVENSRHHDQAYTRSLNLISARLMHLRSLVEGEESSVFLATDIWLSVDHSVIEK